jgi:hypothetical protein
VMTTVPARWARSGKRSAAEGVRWTVSVMFL